LKGNVDFLFEIIFHHISKLFDREITYRLVDTCSVQSQEVSKCAVE